MKTTELLSPAGSLQSVYQAVQNGADAVYLGGKSFGARAFAANFTYDELKQAIDYAHLYGVKVYITVNTLIYENEIGDAVKHIETVYNLGADALIMQDIGLISLTRCCFPDIEVHASTQMHNHNDESLFFVSELGAVRAVLAREMSIEQIKGLTCGIEKEAFIHGALCICYSGQCLMSAMTKGRSGNRGECAQSCRMSYRLVCEDDHAQLSGEYLLSTKDIALFEDVQKLAEANVTCFKIEGRMKPPEYVGHVTKIYRKLLCSYRKGEPLSVSREDIEKLTKLFNRGFSKGHLFGKSGEELMGTLRPNHRGTALGRLLSVSNDRIKIRLEGQLNQGDGIKFEKSDTGFICNRIFKNGRLVASAEKGDVIELDRKVETQTGETVVKTSDCKLLEELQHFEGQRKVKINGHVVARVGQTLRLIISDADGNSVTAAGDTVLPSKTSPTSEAAIRESIGKLGDTPYEFGSLSVDCGEEQFVAKSSLNALRREAVQKLSTARMGINNRRVFDYKHVPVKHDENVNGPRLHVLVRTMEQFEAIKELPIGDIYTSDQRLYLENKNAYSNLRLKTDRLAKANERFSGERLLVTGNGGMVSYRGNNELVIDYTLNVLNSYTAAYFARLSALRIALSPELNTAQIEAMIRGYEKANGQTPALEAIVYARHELMAMQHCILSQKDDCGLCKKGKYALEDLAGSRYPVVTDDACNNYILNSKYVQMDVQKLLALGIKHFRVELFEQNAEKSRETVRRYLDLICQHSGTI
jgi:putative protease